MSVPSPPIITHVPTISDKSITYYFMAADPKGETSSFTLTCEGPGGGTVILPSAWQNYRFINLSSEVHYKAHIVANNAFGTSEQVAFSDAKPSTA